MLSYPLSLQPDALMAHMRAICEGIGPRPSASAQEREAADYVEAALRDVGVMTVARQSFRSQRSMGALMLPPLAAGALAPLLANLVASLIGPEWGKLLGGGLLAGSAVTFRQALLVDPPFFQPVLAGGISQNVIARVPAAGAATQTLYLVGHLDSQKQRFQFPTDDQRVMRAESALGIIAGGGGALALLADLLLRRKKAPTWLWLLLPLYLWGFATMARDEEGPIIQGANDNATAMSVLLGIAEALHEAPLQQTDVVLLFTGCEEVGCVGMEQYLRAFAPSTKETCWIDVEMVGTGDLCYVTRHGVSPLTEYEPHPEMVALAERVAQQSPELGITGRDMIIIEEVANLARRGYRALCVAGYNEKGYLPNWHRLSDNLDNIEPETLGRAAQYVWALTRALDETVGREA